MRKIILLLLFLCNFSANAAFIESDPTLQNVTACGVWIDDVKQPDIPIVVANAGFKCQYNINYLAVGSEHVILMTYVNDADPSNRIESEPSATFYFVVPSPVVQGGALDPPINLRLVNY